MSTFPLRLNIESPNWLRSLRWVAIIGMAGSILAANFIGLELPLPALTALLIFLAIFNLSLVWIEQYMPMPDNMLEFLQICVDLLVLSCVLWFTGGFLNPFVSFYIFHLMIAGLLLTPRLTIAVAAFSVGLIFVLTWAPGWIVDGKTYSWEQMPLRFGVPFGLIFLSICSSGFILAYLKKLHELQQESVQREKMAALGRMMSGIAHEICTPLNSILLLSKDLAENADGNTKQDLQTIQTQTKRCGDLVTLLLGYSKSGVGLNYKKVEVCSWLEDVSRTAKESFQTKREIQYDFYTDINRTDEFLLPELALRQVIFNLYRNSMQALSEVESPRIFTRVMESEKDLRFVVQDNGPGFSSHARERAFEAFFTTKTVGDGIGLGLYVSYHLLEQVGGKISILPALDLAGGAGVEIWFPKIS